MDGRNTRPGEQSRIPLERAIGLRFRHFDDFVEEPVANVSSGGMFVRTRSPHPVGSVFEFELRLGPDLPLIGGKAQVAWVRRRSEEADLPVGMGVRFVELADDSRRCIAELIAAHQEAGAQPLEITPPLETPAPVDAAPHDVRAAASAAPPRAQPATATRPAPTAMPAPSEAVEPRSSRWPWVLLTVALAAALALALWRRPALNASLAADRVSAEQPAAAATGANSAASADTAFREPEQIRLVNAWARAWSEQRVDDYLDAYSLRFSPPAGLDWAVWESQRRARILAPARIEVSLALVELEETDAARSQVRFVQVYESESYRDVVRKVLDLERDESGWKIVRETVEP